MNEQVASVEDFGLDPERVKLLLDRVRQDVDDGLLPAAQVALARNGKVAVLETYGEARHDSLICIFSATKAIVSAATWLLIQDGELAEDECVADIIPEFASHGKDKVTVQQLLTHTAGFPHAPFGPLQWHSKAETLARFAQWRLNWVPGSRVEYHPSSSMWVIAEIIERRGGLPYAEFIRKRVLGPLGLRNLFVGLPEAENQRVLPVEHRGNPMTQDDCKKLGLSAFPETEVTEEALLAFNRPDVRALGMPGAGGFANAHDLALFYQALLHGGLGDVKLWTERTLTGAREIRTGNLADPMFNKAANRGLGIIVSGDASRNLRGFGVTNSAQAFGHNGAGCQLAWADPATGISLAYLTPGHDRNLVHQWQRSMAIGSLAARCAL
ncbi:serine hydrolase domain-containing protein [Hyphomonas sp.]|uniref:serine hydrolase domain-containing protein n=1 Tax=Hyphomonas sp. TaxID=87 RepID=UPI003F6F723A